MQSCWGANVKDSLAYDWLQRFHGCRFVEQEEIKGGLREVPQDIGSRLKISYLIPTRHSSKTVYKKVSATGKGLIDEMDAAVAEAFGASPFLYVPNKNRKSPVLDKLQNARVISTASHGLNQYD